MSAVTLPRPTVATPQPWTPPAPGVFQLDNGIRCFAQHLPGQHVADIRVHLGIDLHAEPSGLDGIAAVMAACLDRGTAGLTAEEFSAALAEDGIDWSTAIDHTGPSIVCQVPADRLPAALELIADALACPSLEPAHIVEARQLHLAQLAQADADPQTRVMRQLPGLVLDPATRAGRPADGTPETVAAITPETLTAFHARTLCAARTTVIIAGDLTDVGADAGPGGGPDPYASPGTSSGASPSARGDLPAMVAERLGGWDTPAPDVAHDFLCPPVVPEATRAVLIDQPDTPQTHLLLAAPTISRHHPDWPALAAAIHILGAPVTGRIDARIRQERGDSYGLCVTSRALTAVSGQLFISGSINAAATSTIVAELFAILRDARTGFTAQECARARAALLGSLPLAYEHAELVAATIADLHTHRLPEDFYARTLTRIAELTVHDIDQAWRDHVDLARLSLAAVGAPDQLDALATQLPMPVTRM